MRHVQVAVDHRKETSRHHGVGVVGVVVAEINLWGRSSYDQFARRLAAVPGSGRRDERLDAEGPRPRLVAGPSLLGGAVLGQSHAGVTEATHDLLVRGEERAAALVAHLLGIVCGTQAQWLLQLVRVEG